MTGSQPSTVFTIPRSYGAASGPGAFCGSSSTAGATGSPSSISVIGSPTALKWPTRLGFLRSSSLSTASGPLRRLAPALCPRVGRGRDPRSGRVRGSGRRTPTAMAIGALDSAIFADMFGTAPMREVFGDDAFLARCVEVEAALARAQGKLGIIPGEAVDAITHAANSLASGREALDLARLKTETETVGYPILPLVRQMAELAGEAGRFLHWGATTQDIMDTAAVLQIRAGLALIEEDLTAVRGH